MLGQSVPDPVWGSGRCLFPVPPVRQYPPRYHLHLGGLLRQGPRRYGAACPQPYHVLSSEGWREGFSRGI